MKTNKVLKILSYILLPIFIAIIIISILYSLAKESYTKNLDNYFASTSFTSDYMELLASLAEDTIYEDSNSYALDGDYKIYYKDLGEYNTNLKLKDNYILIIYKNKAITNVNEQGIDTIEEIKTYIEKNVER